MLRTADLNYELPDGLIATHPEKPRDAARLLVVSRSDPGLLHHRRVRDLPEYLRAGDTLIVNSTRVLPARFRGERADTRGKVDGLYVGPGSGAGTWAVLLKGRRIKPGVYVTLFGRDGRPSGVRLAILERHHGREGGGSDGEESGGWIARMERDPAVEVAGVRTEAPAEELLDRVGLTPLPPYIRQARKKEAGVDPFGDPPPADPEADDADRRDYQTVFAHEEDGPAEDAPGSVAAPTAGLHFTPELLERLYTLGVRRGEVVLHVGLGTFKPVETEHVEEHPMHAEWCRVPVETARLIASTRANGGRVFAVGTTSARTLESFPGVPTEAFAELTGPLEGWTRLLVTPGFEFRRIDGLMTNFHLPGTTLLAMVAALLQPRGETDPRAGVRRLMEIYRAAIEERYRFYSFGDAMLVLP